jgi:hypothetical protein
VKRKLLGIVFAAAFPLGTMAAGVDSDGAAGAKAHANTSGGSLGVGIGAGVSGSGAAVSKESDSSATAGAAASGNAETAGERGRSADLQQGGGPKGDVKVKPRRELQTPRPPREVSVPGGASGSIEGSGAIR